ncbi:MAG: thiolase family protein [bacterium]|nr:thiolase family protein [bacterium]
MRDAVIVEAVRTPVGRRNGTLSHIRPDELAALNLAEIVRRAGVPPEAVDDIIMGCVTQVGEQGFNIGRVAALIAGLPVEVPAVSVNRMCGSSQQAIHFAAQAIVAGDMDLVIAAGVESMSRVTMGSDGGPLSPELIRRWPLVPQGISAEMIAERWGIGRGELDEFSFQSHSRALRATAEGAFEREIMPVTVTTADGSTVTLDRDEGPRPDTSVDKMAGLKPAFKVDGVITAGNSSQISDGAAAVMLASRERAAELGLRPRARVVARAVAAVEPVIMLTGVIPATRKVLARAGLGLEAMDVIEVNEAFASVVLAWQRELDPDLERVNPNGGAIALGHPLGASGARIMCTLLHELERRGGRRGLQVMCIGHGMATATIIEIENQV